MAQSTTADSYAIFKTGGKQYQAILGKTIEVEKLNAQPGQEIVFEEVLLRKSLDPAGKAVIEVGQPFLKTPVKASIVKHERGPKIIVFKFKRRKKYKRKAGHRQPVSVIRFIAV